MYTASSTDCYDKVHALEYRLFHHTVALTTKAL